MVLATPQVIAPASENHRYESGFFEYISKGSMSSADAVVSLISPLLGDDASVLDVGCGQGVWTARFLQEPGVTTIIGVDGDYVDRSALSIAPEDFVAHDLTLELDMERQFTLALSLEVGEHLPVDAGPELVRTLVRHAKMVMFSAAIPGQGGEHHVNERPLSYWREEFARHGFVAFDAIRPQLKGNGSVEPWYRYNTLLYVHEDMIASLPEKITASRIPEGKDIPEAAPLSWRLRCAVIRPLPRRVVDLLAGVKHSVFRNNRALLGNDAGLILRFGLIGVLTAAVYMLGYYGFRQAALTPGPAAGLAYTVAIAVQYFGHARFTFRRAPRDTGQVARFLVLNGVGLGLSVILTLFLTGVVSAPDWVASATVVVVLPLLNWVIMRSWVFR